MVEGTLWRDFVWSEVKQEPTVVDAARFVAAIASLPMAANARGAGADWPAPSGAAQATRFSSLTGISSTNVGTKVEGFWFAG